MTSRKAVYAALFAKLSALPVFVTTSRTLKSWSETPSANQPSLMQAEGKQDSEHKGVGLNKWTFHAELAIYAHQDNCDDGVDVVDLLNDCVDAVLAALAPLPGQTTQTLGDIVTDVRVQGTIETSEGRLGVQAVAVIPITIIATA